MDQKFFMLETRDWNDSSYSAYEYNSDSSSCTALISTNCNDLNLKSIIKDDTEREIIAAAIKHPNIANFLQFCGGKMNFDQMRYVAVHGNITKTDLEEICLQREYPKWLEDKFYEVRNNRMNETINHLRSLISNNSDGYELLTKFISDPPTKDTFDALVESNKKTIKSDYERFIKMGENIKIPTDEEITISAIIKSIEDMFLFKNMLDTIDFSSDETKARYDKIKKELDENFPYIYIMEEYDDYNDDSGHEITLSEFKLPENGIMILSNSSNQSYCND